MTDPIASRIDTYLADLAALERDHGEARERLHTVFKADIAALVGVRVYFDLDTMFLDGTSDEIEREKRENREQQALNPLPFEDAPFNSPHWTLPEVRPEPSFDNVGRVPPSEKPVTPIRSARL